MPTSAEKEAGKALAATSLFESAEMGMSQMSGEQRMESIPEEASKANLHSSHSKVGVLHSGASQPSNYFLPNFPATNYGK
jgi:hypothetical protein